MLIKILILKYHSSLTILKFFIFPLSGWFRLIVVRWKLVETACGEKQFQYTAQVQYRNVNFVLLFVL